MRVRHSRGPSKLHRERAARGKHHAKLASKRKGQSSDRFFVPSNLTPVSRLPGPPLLSVHRHKSMQYNSSFDMSREASPFQIGSNAAAMHANTRTKDKGNTKPPQRKTGG
ncbi:hypothetical protein PSPO01_12326 [Paraphaeosphaeria sporulosa]